MRSVASDHWDKLLERWREQRRDQGELRIPPEPRAVRLEVERPRSSDWYPQLVGGLVESLGTVRGSLPALEPYGATGEALAGFITLDSPELFRQVQSVDERLWRELESRLGDTNLDWNENDFSTFQQNDQARYGLFAARVARDAYQTADMAVQVFAPSHAARDLRDQVRQYLTAGSEEDVGRSLRAMVDELSRLPERIQETWVARAERMDGTAAGRIVLVGSRGDGYFSWDVLLEDMVGAAEMVQAAGAVQFPLMTVLGPAGAVMGGMVQQGLESAIYQQAAPEQMTPERPFQLTEPRARRLAALLVTRFGRGRLAQLRELFQQLDRLVAVLISLRLVHIRRSHFAWDALLTEVVFESRLREWRTTQLRFFVQRVLPVLDLFVAAEDLINELELKDLVEPMQHFLDDVAALVGRVTSILQEVRNEGKTRQEYLKMDLLQYYQRVSHLVKLRAALRRAVRVIDELLALPVVQELGPQDLL